MAEPTDKISLYTKANGQMAMEYHATQSECRRKIEVLTKQMDDAEYPHWINHCVKEIGEAIAKELDTEHWTILGPFGLSNETSIHFGIDVDNDYAYEHSITLVPVDIEMGIFAYKDYSKNTNVFADGTIGDRNGMNYRNITIPDNMTIAELAEVIKTLHEE